MNTEDDGSKVVLNNGDIYKTSGSDREYKPIQKYELTDLLKMKLLEMPDVLEFIVKLQKCIDRQRNKISRLKRKLKKQPTNDVVTQTIDTNTISTKTISEEIKEAAELAVQNTSFVYEETSGLYYDYQSGYYYNAEYGLYYDANSGTYMTYNADKQSYEFHSKVQISKEIAAKPKREKDQGMPQVITSAMENLSQCVESLALKALQPQARGT